MRFALLPIALALALASCGKTPVVETPTCASLPDFIEAVDPLFADLFLARELVFGSGDHLDGLLTRVGISPDDRRAAIDAVADVFDLGRFRAGAPLHIRQSPAGQLLTVHYPVDFEQDLCVWREGDAFEADIFHMDLDWQPFTAEADLAPSFYEDLQRRGHDGDLATRVADLFSGEIDFFFDLHAGDNYKVMQLTYKRKK